MEAMTYRTMIENELRRRRAQNSRYSLRAFARDLEIPPSRLSETMNGKVGLSERRGHEIAERMKLSSGDRELFIALVQMEHSRSLITRALATERVQAMLMDSKDIALDEWDLIADWYHFAILELINLKNFKHSAEDIAARLDISIEVANGAIERLGRLQLMTRENDKFVARHRDGSVGSSIPSVAIQYFHDQMIQKGRASILDQSIEERDLSSISFCIDRSKLGIARERIKAFRRELAKEFETSGDADAVYALNIQLFSLTKQ